MLKPHMKHQSTQRADAMHYQDENGNGAYLTEE
jgi:hypothetical protein